MQPQFPMQNGMRPRMMRPSFGGNGSMMGMGQGPQNPMMRSMMGRPMPMQMNRGGGFLSRIFGRGTQGTGLNGLMGIPQAGRAAGGGGSILQSLSNPGGLSSILNNTQQVIKTAQSLRPMIQQYGPLVRNLPAMWKLYRGLKNASDNDSEETQKSSTKAKKTHSNSNLESSSHESSSKPKKHSSVKTKKHVSNPNRTTYTTEKGSSVPKLYI